MSKHDGRVQVMTYMREEVEEHRDPHTNEVNATTLAEDTCQWFDAYGPPPDYTIPEKYFEWAFLIAEEGKGNIRAAVGGLINTVPSQWL